jgi:serine/threonine protein kinase
MQMVTRAWDLRAFAGADQTANQAPCSVFEYLAGHNLDEVLATWGALPVATAVDWILQAAETVAEAHARGTPHGDLTPASFVVTRRADGRPVMQLAERGVSKLSSAHYMAPEQLRSPPELGVTSDVWALGTILHEMLSAEPAFQGKTLFEVCAAVQMQPPLRLSGLRHDVEPGLEAVVQRCLDKMPETRFPNVREMAWSLSTFGTEEGRASCERIQRTFQSARALAALHEVLAAEAPVREASAEDDPDGDWPGDPASERIGWSSPASPKVVFAGLGMLVVVGVALFALVYVSVHGIDLGSIMGYR